jgi:hypothetical protein
MRPEDLSHEEQDNIIKLALEILSERYQTGTPLTSPHAVRTYLQLQLAERTREVFGAVFLDNKHRVLAFEELFYGTIDGTQIHPRIVVQRSLQFSPVPYKKHCQVGRCRGLLAPLVSSNNLKIVSNARRKALLANSLSGTRLNSWVAPHLTVVASNQPVSC